MPSAGERGEQPLVATPAPARGAGSGLRGAGTRAPGNSGCSGFDARRADTGCIEPVARLLTHESRTPLNAIIGFAELLLAGGSGPLSAEARSWVVNIARAARDLEATMATAGVLIELGLLPPRSGSGPVALGPLLAEAGFEVVGAEGAGGPGLPVILGTADRWVGILGAIRRFQVRRADRRSVCRAMTLATEEGAGVRLWIEPGPVAISDLGKIEIGLAARLAGIEGACLTLGRHGEIRLRWPADRLARADNFTAPMAPDGVSNVS